MSTMAFADSGVNAVIGDASWAARFGAMPEANADEQLRLRVHLEYVEAMLRARVSAAATDVASRMRSLEQLRAYIERGEFPRNHTVQGRRPHFIDEDGRICAVGYLIEQTGGRAAAEQINAKHEWDFIRDIGGIEAWAEKLGLTVADLAMIQPSYEWERPAPSPRPPPPPPDERAVQRRIIMAAFAGAAEDVQRCADRFESWSGAVHVDVTFASRGSVFATGPRVGSRKFRRCVQNEVETAMSIRQLRGRVFPMTVSFTFTIEHDIDEPYDDGGFAQPPPR